MTEEQKFAEAIRAVFELEPGAALIPQAERLIQAAKRGESEAALRQDLGNLQIRLAGRVVDADCRQLVTVLRSLIRGPSYTENAETHVCAPFRTQDGHAKRDCAGQFGQPP